MVVNVYKIPKEKYNELRFDWFYYRKIVLNNNNWNKLIQWDHQCDIIDKPYYIISVEDNGNFVRKYVTGYEIKTDWGIVELPVFDHERGKLKNFMNYHFKVKYKELQINALYSLGFPLTACEIICGYL